MRVTRLLARFQTLQPTRHAHPIVPRDLDQIALAAPKPEYLPRKRITPQPFLTLQSRVFMPRPISVNLDLRAALEVEITPDLPSDRRRDQTVVPGA